MASNIVVLAPNGRRQNVKVNPNTTILQIIEEVCTKQGFKVDEYDVKHHNKVMDVSSIIRFSGLPNNALLEMCPIQKIRTENPVILGLQLENGTRLTGNYFPNDNLWDILNNICPDELRIDTNLVVIYMRQEIYGEESFKKTTLKSLGLTGGRAMLRLLHRTPEELHTQANISAPLPSKPQEEKVEQPFVRKIQRLEPEPEIKPYPKPMSIDSDSNYKPPPSTSVPKKESSNFITDFIKKEQAKKSTDTSKYKSSRTTQENETKAVDVKTEEIKEDIAFLGSRSALAFSLDMAETVPHEELPDEFFDLTIQDARKLLRDMRQKRAALEQTALQTSALRKLEQDKKILRTLHQHKKTIIRIQFPDRTVLQGTFKPLETIKDVKDFVKEYLDNPSNPFHLYTTPPKNVLNPVSSLLDSNCVPSAVVHFSFNLPNNEPNYLKRNLFSKFISQSMASIAAARSRGNEPRLEEPDQDESINLDEIVPERTNLDDVNVGASTSTNNEPGPSYPVTARYSGPQEKVPKWFKPTNK